MAYQTTQDIVIPAGTRVRAEPAGRTHKTFVELASILLPHSEDCTGEWMLPLDEAVKLGLVEEVR
jgi:hypothetical protein